MTPHSKRCYLHNPEITWCPIILEHKLLWLIVAYTWSPKRMERQDQHNNTWLACTERADLHTTSDLHALSMQTCMHWACIRALIKCSDVIISCNDPPLWMWANQFWVLIDVAPPSELCWPMSDYQKDSTSRTPPHQCKVSIVPLNLRLLIRMTLSFTLQTWPELSDFCSLQITNHQGILQWLHSHVDL